MKTLTRALIVLTFVYAIIALVDIYNTKPTTHAHIAAASAYITQNDLETPTNEFVFDGCTAFSDALLGHDLLSACLQHDIAYWVGGTESDRLQADRLLSEQAAQAGNFGSVIGPVMFIGVRILGESFAARAIDKHWGFGWD